MYCIYKLTGENGLVYYGSTTNYKMRLYKHRNDWKWNDECRSKIFKGKFKSEILEERIPHKHIALIREGYYIKNFPCINYINPDKYWNKDNKKKNLIKWRETKQTKESKDREREYRIKRYEYIKSWGGDKRTDNNLLSINI